MATHNDRESQFASLLQSDRLDSYALKHSCLHGIPDGLRAETWRCLLGIVDLSQTGLEAREASKAKRRKQYYDLAGELLAEATNLSTTSDSDTSKKRPTQLTWLDDIDKDVRRTQSSYAFFSQEAAGPPEVMPNARILFDKLDEIHPHRREEIAERYNLPKSDSGDGLEDSIEAPADRHFECLIRLLYIFALLNPVHYVQGMSELVAPVYYVFAQRGTVVASPSDPQDGYAEADAFWAFSTLMAEIGDFYVQDSDGSMQEPASGTDHLSVSTGASSGSRTGLGATLRRYARQLHWLDGELAWALHRKMEIQPTFYALRWVTCLLAMEFSIPDLVRIWDTFFALLAGSAASSSPSKLRSSGARSTADSEARDFIIDVCCAMVLHKRQELLSGNFSSCLGILQNYTCDNVDILITLSFSIRERRISAALTGLDFSDFSSVPNSPAVPDSGDGRFPSPPAAGAASTPLSPPMSSTSLTSAKSMLAGVASSSAAKSLKSRLWGSRSVSAQDFPDDVSEASATTAPATLEGRGLLSPAHRIVSSPPGSATSANAAAGGASLPASASTLFNKYASTLSQSDAAAALSKATTNSYIQALQWREAAPSAISKLRSDVEAKVAEAAGAAKTVIRPPSPNMDPPFTPPTAANGRWLSPDGMNSASSILGERRGSGPKPLLLSSSARRARNQHDTLLTGYGAPSPSSSRRSSHGAQGSLGLGLPSSTSSRHLESPSIPLRSRTPSPTTGFRSLPASHSRAASTGFGTYKIGAAGRNGSDTHTPEHLRAASLSTPTTLPPRAISPASSYHQLGGIPESGLSPAIDEEDDSTDDIPLGSLRLRSNGAQSPAALEEQKRRPLKAQEASPFSVLRSKAASNDLEVLDDGVTESFAYSPQASSTRQEFPAMKAQSPLPPATPPALPRVRTSSLPMASHAQAQAQNQLQGSITDDMPLSPSGSIASLSRSRLPRTTSLASPGGPRSPSHQVSRSEDLGDAPSTRTSQKPRRKLASSRRISSSVDMS